MDTQEISFEEFDEQPGQNLIDFSPEDSGIECPACEQTNMELYNYGTSPDDYTTVLRCPKCHYEENE